MKEKLHREQSTMALKSLIRKQIKNVFTNSLKCIEIKFGDEFAGYDQIRREILRCGNDAIREIDKVIDEDFEIKKLPEIDTIYFKEQERN